MATIEFKEQTSSAEQHIRMTDKLKYREVKPLREKLLSDQGDKCAICGAACSKDQAALDHNHTSGFVREVLHKSCNSFLGKIENNYKRFGVTNLEQFLAGVASYLDKHAKVDPSDAVRHPTHKTPEEKKAARRKKK